MKFLTFEKDGRLVPAVLDANRAVPLSLLGYAQPSLESFIAEVGSPDGIKERLASVKGGFDLSEIKLAAAIPEPTQEIIIMENNYCRDAEEAAQFAEKLKNDSSMLPTYYYKKATLANRDGGVIPSYSGYAEQLDYQAELCAVTSRDAFRAPDAKGYIFGYTVINNVISRALTLRHRRPYISTGLDGFLPMCPFVVTADEFGESPVFTVRSQVNGETRQCASTKLLRFDADYAVRDLSQGSVLRAGSIISLGTPFGSGRDLEPQKYLNIGDSVVCSADGVGSVSNVIG